MTILNINLNAFAPVTESGVTIPKKMFIERVKGRMDMSRESSRMLVAFLESIVFSRVVKTPSGEVVID